MSRLREIASLDIDRLCQLRRVMWSQDGSVILCKGSVLNGSELYTHAFDFETTMAILPSMSLKDNTHEKWQELSVKIEHLIDSRGGLGTGLSEDELRQRSKPMSYWEWRRFRNSIHRAKK